MNRKKWALAAFTAGAFLMMHSTSYARESVPCRGPVDRTRAPIPFVPFPMQNPQTGQVYAPNEEIQVGPRQRLTAAEYFRQLNELEKSWNERGYTLRNQSEYKPPETDICLPLLDQQKAIIESDVDPHPPAPSVLEARKRQLDEMMTNARDRVPSLDALWSVVDANAVESNSPNVPPFTPPVPQPVRIEPPKDVIKRRSWSFEEGSKSTFYVAGEATIGIEGSKDITRLDAHASFSGGVVGFWNKEVLGGDVLAESGENVNSHVKLEMRLMKQTVWAVDPTADPSTNGYLHASELGPSETLDEGWKWYFMFGPIPIKARIGFQGTVGLNYEYDVALSKISADVRPYVEASVTAQVGVDILFAGADIRATLVLVKDSLPLHGDASFTFVDAPQLELNLSADNDLVALAGDVSLHAYIHYLIGKWEDSWTIFSWNGFNKIWKIFHFHYKWTPTGASADGDVKAEDLMDLTAQNAYIQSTTRLNEVTQAIAADFNGPKPGQVIEERTRLAANTQALDTKVDAYVEQLKQWIGPQ